MIKGKSNVYIDESGIHRTTQHSSFVLVYVAVQDDQIVREGIEKIEKDLDIPPFHWADYGMKKGWLTRKTFLHLCAKLPFKFKCSVVKNPTNSSQELYNSLATLLVENTIEKLWIDGKQPKWYERQIKKFLRDKGISVKKLKTTNDQSVPVIRLADALAGLIRIHHDRPDKAIEELFNNIKRNHLQ